ncbi:hypothetical protein [Streptomyces atratus]
MAMFVHLTHAANAARLRHRLGQDPHPDVREAVEFTRPDQP